MKRSGSYHNRREKGRKITPAKELEEDKIGREGKNFNDHDEQ